MLYRFKSFNRVALSLAVVLAVIVMGRVGFMLLEDYTFVEAFYMTMITVSTVGLVPKIRQLAEEGLQVTLAVSLHAATDTARRALMPVNKRWPIGELVEATEAQGKRHEAKIWQ